MSFRGYGDDDPGKGPSKETMDLVEKRLVESGKYTPCPTCGMLQKNEGKKA